MQTQNNFWLLFRWCETTDENFRIKETSGRETCHDKPLLWRDARKKRFAESIFTGMQVLIKTIIDEAQDPGSS